MALFAGDIKISHTIFALPWAVLATLMAWRDTGGTLFGKLGLILVCMVTARTVAMASNRLVDAQLDALNPRTRNRALPAGKLSRGFYFAVVSGGAVTFIAATLVFYFRYDNPYPALLSVPVLTYLCAYPLMKRFTRLCHYYLGAALALAPVCAYLAVAGTLTLPPVLMAGAVLLWTAGFDIIYACQDFQSDLETRTYSVPAKVGIGRALVVARATHLLCAVCLVLLGVVTVWFGLIYSIGVAGAMMLLVIEHTLVKANDLSKVNLAFFTFNGIISVMVCALGVIDLFV